MLLLRRGGNADSDLKSILSVFGFVSNTIRGGARCCCCDDDEMGGKREGRESGREESSEEVLNLQ